MSETNYSAVNGWKQAVGIIRKLRDGLDFTITEMRDESKHNPRAFGTDREKAETFVKAEAALNLANDYLAAMDRAAAS